MSHYKCFLCGAQKKSTISHGVFKITCCDICQLQCVEDYEKHLDDNWFDNYYRRRKDNSKIHLNEKREQQYKLDASIVKEFLKDGDTVLDVGCSYGKFLHLIASLRKNLNCIGIDIDQFAISEANQNFGDSAEFYNKSFLSVDRQDEFNLVIFRGTLQYLGETLAASLTHLHSILKNDGRIIIFSLPSTDAFMYELLGEKWALFHPEMQLMFNEYSLRIMADIYGFVIEDLQYPYLEDVYANPKEDYDNVKNIILGNSEKSNPFWGSIMRAVLSKKIQ